MLIIENPALFLQKERDFREDPFRALDYFTQRLLPMERRWF